MKISTKKKKVIKYKNNIISNISILYIIIIFIINISLCQILSNLRKLTVISEIIITIEGNGTQQILSDSTAVPLPNEILVNGIPQTEISKFIDNLENGKNNITMRWNTKLETFAGMFKDLNKITDVYFTKIDTSQVTDMSYMFSKTSISSLDLSCFNTSSVINFGDMFRECPLITSLNLSNFDTSSSNSIRGMFHSCNALKVLDISNFDTSKVTNMKSLFFNCYSLEKLDLRHFDVSLVTNMNGMFYGCSTLTTLDLSNFRTPALLDIGNLFEQCHGLQYLNIDNFDTSKTTNFHVMFNGCSSLISLNLNSFNTSSYTYGHSSFFNMNANIIFTIDVNKASRIISQYEHLTIDETNICFENSSKLIVSKGNCTLDCKTDDTYQFEFDNLCYDRCPDDTHPLYNNNYLCKKNPIGFYLDNNVYRPCYSVCKRCYGDGNEDNNNCKECISDYILMSDSIYNKNCYQKCYNYYYYDSLNNFHCTENKTCPNEYNILIENKNRCIDNCTNDNLYRFEYENKCFSSCPINTHISLDNNYSCIKNIENDDNNDNSQSEENNKNTKPSESEIKDICPINLPYEKNYQCVELCSALEFLYKECKINNHYNLTAKDYIINNIKNEISKKGLDSLLSNVISGDKNDYIINDSDIIYQFTSSYNQKNKEYNNMSSIILGECERKLREHYNIKDEDDLLIFKLDIFEEGLLIPIIQYEIYHPYTLEKLDLNYCENTKIEISFPVNINESCLFKYNSSHEYYNDICYAYTTDDGTDIIIKDRQNEYIENNMSLCESNCEYIKYNSSSKKSFCECEPKNAIVSMNDIINNENKLLKTFKDLKNAINLNIMKCIKKLFTYEGLINNIGSYCIATIIIINIILTVLFKIKGYNIITNLIDNLIKKKSIIENNFDKEKIDMKLNEKNSINESIYKNGSTNKKMKKKRRNSRKKTTNRIVNKINNPIKKSRNSKIIIDDIDCIPSKNEQKSNSKYSEDLRIFPNKIHKEAPILENNNIQKIEKDNKLDMKKIQDYNDYELNSLFYMEALEIDNRSYFQYYFSLLRQKHIIVFTFITNNDYNSRIIKIFLFFFSFALYYTVNALFFNYTTLHKIYIDKGSFDFLFQIPQILYSTIISSIINIIVKTLSLSQKNILEIKEAKTNVQQVASNILKCLVIKFLLFFILSFLFLLLFWYYLSCFCAVYNNTQKHLIEDTLISYILSLIYPFLLNLIPGIFRIPSLRCKNKDKLCLYKFSQIVQII